MDSSYSSTIDFLYRKLPNYQRVGPSAIKKDLSNINRLLEKLGSPHGAFKSIHIAGTNGKGTTAHIIAGILQASGLKVGLYTSPHYVDFRERIKVDGTYISEKEVTQFVEEWRALIEDIRPSFFEITVAMAFSHFAKQKVDIAIVETGLGGRLDSTNVLDPLLTVITHISLDHQDILGPNVYTISKEKAGIIKYRRPVVIGRYQPSCDQIFMSTARLLNAPIAFASLRWRIDSRGDKIMLSKTGMQNVELDIKEESPFFLENVITALESILVYRNISQEEISRETVIKGISEYRETTNYKGRWVKLGGSPTVLADSGHNLDAIRKVIQHLRGLNYRKIHFILGFVKGKDVRDILKLLRPSDAICLTRPTIDRGMALDEVKYVANELGLTYTAYPSVDVALAEVKKIAESKDLIYVGGSSFVVADLLQTKRGNSPRRNATLT